MTCRKERLSDIKKNIINEFTASQAVYMYTALAYNSFRCDLHIEHHRPALLKRNFRPSVKGKNASSNYALRHEDVLRYGCIYPRFLDLGNTRR
jgi:hypothetical protein